MAAFVLDLFVFFAFPAAFAASAAFVASVVAVNRTGLTCCRIRSKIPGHDSPCERVQHLQSQRVLRPFNVIYKPFDYFFTSYDTAHITEHSDQSQDAYPQLFPYSATEHIPAP